MALDSRLLAILVDPEDKQPLIYVEESDDVQSLLYNPRARRKYPIRNNIPVLLVEDAEVATDEEHARFSNEGTS